MAHFTKEEFKEIEKFLNRGFSIDGQFAIAILFLRANAHQKSLTEVLNLCKDEWRRSWVYRLPRIRGDPNVQGSAGQENRTSLENIYRALGIPYQTEEIKITDGEFTVITEKSTYHFGKINERGLRTVSRDEKPTLTFSECLVGSLAIGHGMEIQHFDTPKPRWWYTSPVLSVDIKKHLEGR